MKKWLLRGITDGETKEIEAETADEAREKFAKQYPGRTNGGNPKYTNQPILIKEQGNK